ncbi:MAG TPA: hypothetical protein VG188_09470 [Solirubrobacteraceae bacterium]|jgi:uncharacterized membrane protein|nr:hypothetical protein [Solirubrobacteraceae bacterium]
MDKARNNGSDGVGPVRIADAFGWFSSLLGAPMLLTPRRFLRAIGVQDDGRAVAWTVGVGVREQIAMLNIVANRQRRIGMWSRAAGDTMDLALLLGAYRLRPRDKRRLLETIAGAAVVGAADAAVAILLSRADGSFEGDGGSSEGEGVAHDSSGGPSRVRTAITIRCGEDEVRQAFREHQWSAFDPDALERDGEARIVPAPGGRGVELHIDHDPGSSGRLGAIAAKATGSSPDQQIDDELRRFKSLLETGTVARSETSPDGPSSRSQILHKAQPAQPVAEQS